MKIDWNKIIYGKIQVITYDEKSFFFSMFYLELLEKC